MHPNNWQCRQHRKNKQKRCAKGGSRLLLLRVLEEHGFQKNMDSRRTWIPEEHGFQKDMDPRGA
jgi:hypothetical protein